MMKIIVPALPRRLPSVPLLFVPQEKWISKTSLIGYSSPKTLANDNLTMHIVWIVNKAKYKFKQPKKINFWEMYSIANNVLYFYWQYKELKFANIEDLS